jgi:hypothetical protein
MASARINCPTLLDLEGMRLAERLNNRPMRVNGLSVDAKRVAHPRPWRAAELPGSEIAPQVGTTAVVGVAELADAVRESGS